MKITIDESGTVRFLVNEETNFLVDQSSIVRRASHVEPWNVILRMVFHTLRAMFGEYGRIADWTRNWAIDWRVNLGPVNGPVIPIIFTNRQTAIDFEISWIEENFL